MGVVMLQLIMIPCGVVNGNNNGIYDSTAPYGSKPGAAQYLYSGSGNTIPGRRRYISFCRFVIKLTMLEQTMINLHMANGYNLNFRTNII